MQRTVRTAFLFILLMVCTAIGASRAISRELTVRVPLNPYPPTFLQSDDGKWYGLSIELIEAVLAQMDCTAVYEPIPFKRALSYMESGDLDIMLNLSKTEKREQFIHFVGPQKTETVILMVHKDTDFKINSLDDFKKLPGLVGIERGIYYGEKFENKRKTDAAFAARLEDIATEISNIRKLEMRRISGFLNYQLNAVYQMKTNPAFKNFKVAPFIVFQDVAYFGLSKKALPAETRARFEKAYRQARSKGELDAIWNRYGMAPFQQPEP